uniref:Tetratricopeptide repeat protein 21B n=1 Tax=Schistocephalus solidus TaxID=70667 RepID=A0A0X3P822_SCHSO
MPRRKLYASKKIVNLVSCDMKALCSLDKHYNLLSAVESNNRYQFEQMANLIYRVSGRNVRLLKKAYQFAERALEISPNSFSSIFTMAKICFAQGSHKETMRYLKKAMKLNESSVETMCSIVNCQLMQHCLKDAKLQLELLEELQPTIGSSPMIVYLQAILLLEEGRPSREVLAKLDQAMDLHFKNLKKATPSVEYYCEMDPDFLLQLVDAYFSLSVQPTPIPAGIEKSLRTVDVLKASTMWPNTQHILSRCQKILGRLTDALPGLQWANYLFAYLHLIRGDYNQALSFSQAALEIDPTCSTAHVLQAQIYLAQSNLRKAEQTLEIGLSNNFELRNHPLNSLVQAKIHMQDLMPEKAIELLNQALTNPEAPGLRSVSAASSGSGRTRDARDVIQGNSRRKQAHTEFWTTIYLEIVTAYRSLGKFREATKTLSEAQQVFSGTAEVDRLAIAAADVAVADADLDTALTVLRPIPSDTPYYLIAKQRMADIYLNQRKEKRLYIACYREMVETMGNSLSQLLLGDAYMKIQDPQKAIEVYEAVLRKNPDDLTLASKMGEALVMTHEYERAIAYYESAVHGGQLCLQSDLIVLLIKLRQFSKAEELLMDSYNSLIDSTKTVDLQRSSDVLVLLAIIYGQQGRQEEQLETLDRAKLKQTSIIQSVCAEESTDLVRACKRSLASILICMAQVRLDVHLSTADGALESTSPTREKSRYKDKEEAGAGDENSRATPARPPGNLELAIECCNAAIKEMNSMHSPDLLDRIKHTAALSLLARCHLASRDRAPCEQTCLKLALLQEELVPQLKRDRQHTLEVRLEMFHPLVAERTPGGSTQSTYPVRVGDCGVKFVPAAIIMSDLQTTEGNFAGACPHLEKHIAEEPDDAEALIRLVKTYRRMGQLSKVSVLLDKLDKVIPAGQTNSGHKFARGLYHWYIGDSCNALKHFNLSRLDATYMEEATCNMVEICVNPNNRVIGSLIFDTERRITPTDAQRAAEVGSERATNGYGDNSGMDASSLAVSSGAGGDSAEAVGHQTAERLLKTLNAKKGQTKCPIFDQSAQCSLKE